MSVSPPARTTNAADRRVLSRLRGLMNDELMRFLTENNFAGWSFATDQLNPLITVASYHVGAEHEFLDPELEEKRQRFLKATTQFLNLVGDNARPVPGQSAGRVWVPEDWEDEKPEVFRKLVKELDDRADKVWKSYDDLLRTARQKFGV